MTEKAQDYINKKIKILMEEGYPQDQAIAMAYSYAKEKGYDVPKKSYIEKEYSLLKIALHETQLEKGIKVESEHDSIFHTLEKWAKKYNVPLPFTIEEFRKKIAQGHIKEITNYYDKLLSCVENNQEKTSSY